MVMALIRVSTTAWLRRAQNLATARSCPRALHRGIGGSSVASRCHHQATWARFHSSSSSIRTRSLAGGAATVAAAAAFVYLNQNCTAEAEAPSVGSGERAAAGASQPDWVEPYTGHRFAQHKLVWTVQPWACRVDDKQEMQAECQRENLQLVGVGVRCMLDNCSIPLLRAYSIGVYLDQKHFQASSTAGHSLQQALTCAGTTRSLRLVMARNVSAGHIAHGLQRSISKHLTNDAADRPTLDKLVKVIRDGRQRLEAGEELVLTCSAHGDIVVEQCGKVLATLTSSSSFCDSLMDTYIGDQPVSKRAKNSLLTAWSQHAKAVS